MNFFQGKKIYLVLMGLVLIILAETAFIIRDYKQDVRLGSVAKSDKDQSNVKYTIPNVPYVGIYNHVGRLSYATSTQNNDATGGVTTILEYWYPNETNFSEIRHTLSATSTGMLITMKNVKDAFYSTGKFKVEEVRLKTSELGKYVNEDIKTPLLFHASVDKDQPSDLPYHPMKVIIGVDNPGKKITIHDYWLGSNYEMSFDDLDRMWANMRPDQSNLYIVAQPIDFEEKIKEVNSRVAAVYPDRTEAMRANEAAFKNYAKGHGAFAVREMDRALEYFQSVEQDAAFGEYFPNIFKVLLYQRLMGIYMEKKDFDKAIAYGDKSISLNHDLDRPFRDWPGYELREVRPDISDKLASPFRVIGQVYMETKDYARAKESFEKALEINPADESAGRWLTLAKYHIAAPENE